MPSSEASWTRRSGASAIHVSAVRDPDRRVFAQGPSQWELLLYGSECSDTMGVGRLLRLSEAAARVGVHPLTLRKWANDGKVATTRAGKERRFATEDLDALCGVTPPVRVRVEALYVRVSGSSGQESSLTAQEQELRLSSTS
jgi:excisionase family DNA binding protein